MIGNAREETQPNVVALIRLSATAGVIISIVP
jgi:hypothetical protein